MMATNTDYDHVMRSQLIFAANIAAKMAAASTHHTDSARTWDQSSGFIDSTNSDQIGALFADSYKVVADKYRTPFSAEDESLKTDRLPLVEWAAMKTAITHFPKTKSYPTILFDIATDKEPTGTSIATTSTDCPIDSKAFVLFLTFSSEMDRLERDISASIRKPLRARLRFLLDTSIEEQSDEQDFLKIESLQGIYKFLEHIRSPKMPSLTLTRDGHIYAHWRESTDRAVGARFISASLVNFAIRNNNERGGLSTTPARFFETVSALGLSPVITDTIEKLSSG